METVRCLKALWFVKKSKSKENVLVSIPATGYSEKKRNTNLMVMVFFMVVMVVLPGSSKQTWPALGGSTKEHSNDLHQLNSGFKK